VGAAGSYATPERWTGLCPEAASASVISTDESAHSFS
jgi:hypothetical protein